MHGQASLASGGTFEVCQHRQYVADGADEGADRVAGKAEHGLACAAAAEPERLAWALRYAVEHLLDAECAQGRWHMVELAHGDAARKHEHVVGGEQLAQRGLQ